MSNFEVGIFSEPKRWAAPASTGGGFVLTDPVTGNRLSPNVPPAWIEEDPLHHAGLEFLRQRGNDVTLTIGYGAHGTAEHLGNIQKGWYEAQVAAADYYGYEEVGHSQQRTHRLRFQASQTALRALNIGKDLAAYQQTAMRDPAYRRRTSFDLRMERAILLAGSGTRSFSYDIASDGTKVEQALVRALDAHKYPANQPCKRRRYGGAAQCP